MGVRRRSLVAGAIGTQLLLDAGLAPSSPSRLPRDLSSPLWPEAGSGSPHSADAELLRQCETAHVVEAEAVDGADERWNQALRQVSALRPTTQAGLQAKTRLALSMLPFGSASSCPDWVSPDERLVWSLLRDVLALSENEGS